MLFISSLAGYVDHEYIVAVLTRNQHHYFVDFFDPYLHLKHSLFLLGMERIHAVLIRKFLTHLHSVYEPILNRSSEQ